MFLRELQTAEAACFKDGFLQTISFGMGTADSSRAFKIRKIYLTCLILRTVSAKLTCSHSIRSTNEGFRNKYFLTFS